MKYQITALSILLLLVTGCLSDKPSRSEEPKAPETTPATEPPNGESFSVSEINLDMLWCKPGTFMMGSPEDEAEEFEEETRHEETLTKGFYLGKYNQDVHGGVVHASGNAAVFVDDCAMTNNKLRTAVTHVGVGAETKTTAVTAVRVPLGARRACI